MSRLSLALLALALSPIAARAQGAPLPPAQQVAAAILPLPRELRDGATVLGYDGSGKLVPLREGKGEMLCLADDPAIRSFHVACYHKSLEPFMARGRALRASGVKGAQVDTVRFAEIRSGKLAMPRGPTSLYTLTDPDGGYDAAANAAPRARGLHVVYIPFATTETTGISATPSEHTAWLMYPGTPKAHIMFTTGM
jgi:hypothetical protein